MVLLNGVISILLAGTGVRFSSSSCGLHHIKINISNFSGRVYLMKNKKAKQSRVVYMCHFQVVTPTAGGRGFTIIYISGADLGGGFRGLQPSPNDSEQPHPLTYKAHDSSA